jgi:threonine dehydratase
MLPRVTPTVDEIEHAARHLDPAFAHSPLLRAGRIDGGAELVMKVETLNPIRSFKGRGATTWMREEGGDSAGVVCASAGNFGQGLAYAAREKGVRCRVFVGASANPVKVEAMRRLDAVVEIGGPDYDAAIETARDHAARNGWQFVQDGCEPWIAAGAGTIAKELTDAGVVPDVALVPVGNSALILGIARWLRHHDPAVRVIGVCAEEAPAPALSWREGRVVSGIGSTAADGIAVSDPFPESIAAMREIVDDMVLVPEHHIRGACRWLAAHCSLLVEAGGAAGVAALLADPERFAGKTVFTPLCGGHLPPDAIRWADGWR